VLSTHRNRRAEVQRVENRGPKSTRDVPHLIFVQVHQALYALSIVFRRIGEDLLGEDIRVLHSGRVFVLER